MATRVGVLAGTVDPVLDRSPLSMRVRVMRLLTSWVLVAIGVPLLVRAGLGVAPFDVLNTGVADVTGLSFGTVFIVDGLACFAIGTILGARPGPASWVGGFVIGALINVSMSLIPEPDVLAARIPMLAGGIVIIAAGICSVISTDLGAGPSEVVMLGLIKHRVGVVVARWVSDGVPMLLGVALGGDLGIGTLVFLVTMGPLVKFGLRRLHYVPSGLHAAGTGPAVRTSPTFEV